MCAKFCVKSASIKMYLDFLIPLSHSQALVEDYQGACVHLHVFVRSMCVYESTWSCICLYLVQVVRSLPASSYGISSLSWCPSTFYRVKRVILRWCRENSTCKERLYPTFTSSYLWCYLWFCIQPPHHWHCILHVVYIHTCMHVHSLNRACKWHVHVRQLFHYM